MKIHKDVMYWNNKYEEHSFDTRIFSKLLILSILWILRHFWVVSIMPTTSPSPSQNRVVRIQRDLLIVCENTKHIVSLFATTTSATIVDPTSCDLFFIWKRILSHLNTRGLCLVHEPAVMSGGKIRQRCREFNIDRWVAGSVSRSINSFNRWNKSFDLIGN